MSNTTKSFTQKGAEPWEVFHVKWKCDIQVFSLQAYEGDVGPFMSVKIPIVFTPTIPGEAKLDFQIMFSQPGCEPVEFSHNYKQCFTFPYFIFALTSQNINFTFLLVFWMHRLWFQFVGWQRAHLCGWPSQMLTWKSACMIAFIRTASKFKAGELHQLDFYQRQDSH